MLLLTVLCLILLSVVDSSLFCPHTVYPSQESEFRTVTIQVQEPVQSDQYPIYRIAAESGIDVNGAGVAAGNNEGGEGSNSAANANNFVPVTQAGPFRVLSSIENPECPSRGCVTELSVAQPKYQGSYLYHTNLIGKVIPPGFNALDVPDAGRMYCAIVENDCGATVPIYRHFRFVGAKIYHAYSMSANSEIANYTREPGPLCFGWSANHQVQQPVVSQDAGVSVGKFFAPPSANAAGVVNSNNQPNAANCQAGQNLVPNNAMAVLNEYDNHKSGALRDHWYTTKAPADKEYALEGSMGKVVVQQEMSGCNCLVQLNQMLDNQGLGILGRIDHKLMLASNEPANLPADAAYKPVGEQIFCAQEMGACGATLPMRKFFRVIDIDTLYTVNSSQAPAFSVPAPADILCYIWAMDYNFSPVTSPPSQMPTSQPPQMPTSQPPHMQTSPMSSNNAHGNGVVGNNVQNIGEGEQSGGQPNNGQTNNGANNGQPNNGQINNGANSGHANNGQSGNGQAGNGQAGNGQSGNGQASGGQLNNGQSGNGQSGNAQAGNGQSGNGQAGNGQAGNGQSGNGQSGNGQANGGQPNKGQAGNGQAGNGQAGNGQAGNGQAGNGQAGNGQSGNVQPNNWQAGNGQANGGQPNNGQVNIGQLNNGQPNNGQSNNGQHSSGQENGGQQPNNNGQANGNSGVVPSIKVNN